MPSFAIPVARPTVHLQTAAHGPLLVVRPAHDRLNAHLAGAFRTALLDLFESGHERLVVDLSGVAFMDSSALGALVAVHKRCVAENGLFLLCDLSPAVASLFDLTRMSSVFRIYPTVTDAVATYAPNHP
ncbi:MAG: STAS domain-containing protein [Bacteroidota bacterium]